MHCGLCQSACPTYIELGTEADSPRGRIHLMRALEEGRLEPSPEVVRHLDLCLGCRACETACPSGVPYGALIEDAKVNKSDFVLVPAASSSVALAAIQIANYAGATSIALTRTSAKRKQLIEAGATSISLALAQIVRHRDEIPKAFERIGAWGG